MVEFVLDSLLIVSSLSLLVLSIACPLGLIYPKLVGCKNRLHVLGVCFFPLFPLLCLLIAVSSIHDDSASDDLLSGLVVFGVIMSAISYSTYKAGMDKYRKKIGATSRYDDSRAVKINAVGNTKQDHTVGADNRTQKTSNYSVAKSSEREKRKLSTPVISESFNDIATVEFTYIDREFSVTKRKVTFRNYANRKIEAYCHKRRAMRTFHIDSIQNGEVTIVATGEMLSTTAWITRLNGGKQSAPGDRSRGSTKTNNAGSRAPKSPSKQQIEVCFTGFRRAEKESLELLALEQGYVVRASVTKNLTVLVTGANAGPSKIEQAYEVGAEILDEEAFQDFVNCQDYLSAT